jgi:CheY-like chemotaxis protein
VNHHSSAVEATRPSLRLPNPWCDIGRNNNLHSQQVHHDSLRILIVNDDMRSAAMLKETLCTLGYSETMVAYSGHRALAAVSAYSPAVAIVDLELGDMTGYSLARSLRTHAARQVRELPLIAVAERCESAGGALARSAGFLGLLTKPVPAWLLSGLLLRSLP